MFHYQVNSHYLLKKHSAILNGNHVLNYLYQFHEPYINFPFVFYGLAISILLTTLNFKFNFFSFIKSSRLLATGQEEISCTNIQPLIASQITTKRLREQPITKYIYLISFYLNFFQDPL